MSSSSSAFDLEDLLHLEQTFFDAGYTDGYAHGCTHGLIEGRALGRAKGYEMWQEVGFCEGFAKVWEAACQTKDVITTEKRSENNARRSEVNIRHLLDLVSQFPLVNPSSEAATPKGRGSPEDAELDVTELLNQIRARHKALCATLEVHPRSLPVKKKPHTIRSNLELDPETQRRSNLSGPLAPPSPVEDSF